MWALKTVKRHFSSPKTPVLEKEAGTEASGSFMRKTIRPMLLASVLPLALSAYSAKAQTTKPSLDIALLYVEQRIERPPVLSNLVQWPEGEGVQGALLGVDDNNTTGRFLGQQYSLESMIFQVGTDPVVRNEQIKQALAAGPLLVITNLPASDLVAIAQLPEAADDLIFNAQSADNELRNEACQSNVLHTAPSRSMLSDGLAQFFTYKKWEDVFLVEGNRTGDQAFASAIRQSLTKFGLKTVADKQWIEDADMRRSASSEVPVFTQARRYDVVVVTDEDQDFAQYIPYNTWLPRPVAGSAGLTPVAWSPVIEQWGAAQLQSRFNKLASRTMTSLDYSNWAAARAVGEAVTRTNSTDPSVIKSYLMSDEFELGGFKGSPLSFRQWNGQMRQPVQLVHANAVVASAPLEGFLHAVTELDTLGYDKGDSDCGKFQ